jgi:hypothetical protein
VELRHSGSRPASPFLCAGPSAKVFFAESRRGVRSVVRVRDRLPPPSSLAFRPDFQAGRCVTKISPSEGRGRAVSYSFSRSRCAPRPLGLMVMAVRYSGREMTTTGVNPPRRRFSRQCGPRPSPPFFRPTPLSNPSEKTLRGRCERAGVCDRHPAPPSGCLRGYFQSWGRCMALLFARSPQCPRPYPKFPLRAGPLDESRATREKGRGVRWGERSFTMPPYPPPSLGTASRITGPMCCSHVLSHVRPALDPRNDVIRRQWIPRFRSTPADPADRLLEANLPACLLVRPAPSRQRLTLRAFSPRDK